MTSYERGWRDAVSLVLDRVETLSSLAETSDERKFARAVKRSIEPLNTTPPVRDLDFATLKADADAVRAAIEEDPQAALAAGLTPLIEKMFKRAGGK
jgi:hypothetical protein